MPSLREDQQPDAVIDLRPGTLQRAPTDEVVVVHDGLPELPPEPVFAQEPVDLDPPGSNRKRRRVADLEAVARANAAAAREAQQTAREQWAHLDAARRGWRATAAELADLRRDLKALAAARADLVATERARAAQSARTDVAADLQQLRTERDELRAETDGLRVALADQQARGDDTGHRIRDEQRARTEAEKEAKRAIAAYETAERKLEAAGDVLRRHAIDEQARIDAVEADRAAALAELEALGGGGRVEQLTSRVEDLVGQLAELDGALVAERVRADAAESASAAAAGELARQVLAAEHVGTEVSRANARIAELTRGRDALRAAVGEMEADASRREVDAAAAQARADRSFLALEDALEAERTAAAERARELERGVAAAQEQAGAAETALAAARADTAAADDRATVTRVRLERIGHERDELLASLAALEHEHELRERRASDEVARAGRAAEQAAGRADPAGATDPQDALVAARFEAESLRGETTALAAQLEEAWAQVEEARRIAEAARSGAAEPAAEQADAAGTVDSVATDRTLLDAFAELAAEPGDDEAVDPDARFAPRPPDPEDPDARRAALGFLNSLATDVPPADGTRR